jgi:endonuclease G
VTSYNRIHKNPNWVAEHLTKASLIKQPEEGNRLNSYFKEDKDIPELYRSHLSDYVSSGYDRGHMVPAADIHGSQEQLNETFLLSNVCPQIPLGFNRGYWAQFERFTRHLTNFFDDVYVFTGPLYLPKKDEKDGHYYVKYRVLGNPPNTSVPTHFFKVILAITR